jgi:formyltetrahydrofolate synthetase
MGEMGVKQTHSMTTDNAPAVVASIENLKTNEGLVEMTHQRCGTHVLNLIVQSGLKNLGESYDKIRFFCNKVNILK